MAPQDFSPRFLWPSTTLDEKVLFLGVVRAGNKLDRGGDLAGVSALERAEALNVTSRRSRRMARPERVRPVAFTRARPVRTAEADRRSWKY